MSSEEGHRRKIGIAVSPEAAKAAHSRQAPGRAQIDFARIVDALEGGTCSGPLGAEILPLPDDQTAVRDAAPESLAIDSPR